MSVGKVYVHPIQGFFKTLLAARRRDSNFPEHACEKILDLCTGTGELALALAHQGAEVVSIDIARGMLKRAQTKSPSASLTWVEPDAPDRVEIEQLIRSLETEP